MFVQKKNESKLVMLILVFVLFLFCGTSNVDAAEKTGTVTFAVEKFTIGQGYLIEPCQVDIYDGDRVSSVVDRVLTENGFEYTNDGSISDGFYLAMIYNADTGEVKIPAIINQGLKPTKNNNGVEIPLPTSENINDENNGNPYKPRKEDLFYGLGEFAYNNMSGWMYTVDSVFETGMAAVTPKDGQVIRIQFTLYGYGRDLGEEYEDGNYLKLPDRDALTKRLALMNKNKASWLDKSDWTTAYNAAHKAVIDLNTGEKKMTEVLDALPSEEEIKEQADAYDKKIAQETCEKIEAIGTVTLAKEEAVKKARNAYNALSADQKKLVSTETLKILEEAEAQIKVLNQKAADTVKEQINAIGTVTLAKEAVVKKARNAYNALSADQKKLVSAETLAVLKSAETKVTELKKQKAAADAAAKAAALKKKYTPAKTTLKSVKVAGSKKAKLAWKKVSAATGYEIYRSTKKTSGYKKIKTIKKAKTVTYKATGLKKKKTYYFKIRTYRKVGKTTYYGAYSNVKKIKAK